MNTENKKFLQRGPFSIFTRTRMLFSSYPLKNEIIRVIPYFLQMGALHIANTVLKERDGRYKTVCSPFNFYDQNRFFLYGVHACEIRFKSIHPRVCIYRQRTQEGVLKAQFIYFYRLTPKDDFILIPFLCQ